MLCIESLLLLAPFSPIYVCPFIWTSRTIHLPVGAVVICSNCLFKSQPALMSRRVGPFVHSFQFTCRGVHLICSFPSLCFFLIISGLNVSKATEREREREKTKAKVCLIKRSRRETEKVRERERERAFAFNHWICHPRTIYHNFHFLHFYSASLTSLFSPFSFSLPFFSVSSIVHFLVLLQTVSKIVRFLGKNVTEKVFLCHFSRLCSDVSFHVRRACAANFGEICSVVGEQLTESILVSIFLFFYFLSRILLPFFFPFYTTFFRLHWIFFFFLPLSLTSFSILFAAVSL